MTISTTAVRGAVLAAALLLAGAVPAQGAAPGDWLYLTVTKGDARSGDTRGTLLLCDPPQGHSRAVEACAQLAAANGDIAALPAPKDAFCPMLYAPVTARARGEWNGRQVDYTRTFPNACALRASTGAVFAVDG
ncbi:SSI family serine proteinase inhibitor [Streptomyces sp. 7R007]